MLVLEEAMPKDDAFLYEVYASTREREFAMLGWPQHQLEALLQMQYHAQKVFYQQKFSHAKYELILLDGRHIGRIITEMQQESLRLIDISLLPQWRGKGIGTTLLKQLQSFVSTRVKSIKLHVLMGNPAQRLYERCGFVVVAKAEPFLAMEWQSKDIKLCKGEKSLHC